MAATQLTTPDCPVVDWVLHAAMLPAVPPSVTAMCNGDFARIRNYIAMNIASPFTFAATPPRAPSSTKSDVPARISLAASPPPVRTRARRRVVAVTESQRHHTQLAQADHVRGWSSSHTAPRAGAHEERYAQAGTAQTKQLSIRIGLNRRGSIFSAGKPFARFQG